MSDKKTKPILTITSENTVLFDDKIPQLPDFKSEDWYRVLQDIDKPILLWQIDKKDGSRATSEVNQALKLVTAFAGVHNPDLLKQLLDYWTLRRDRLIKQLEDQNIGRTTLIGVDKANQILAYERAIWIAINKYIQNCNKLYDISLAKDYPAAQKKHISISNLPQVAQDFQPNYGLVVLNQYCEDILDRTYSERIKIDDNRVAAILNESNIIIDGLCPTIDWKDISFVFIRKEEIEFRFQGKLLILHPDYENGLKSKDRKLTAECRTLWAFALARGVITKHTRKIIRDVRVTQKNVSRLRKWLKTLTGQQSNPIKYNMVDGYKCQFSVQQVVYTVESDGTLTDRFVS